MESGGVEWLGCRWGWGLSFGGWAGSIDDGVGGCAFWLPPPPFGPSIHPSNHPPPPPHQTQVEALWRRVRREVLDPLEAALARFDPRASEAVRAKYYDVYS